MIWKAIRTRLVSNIAENHIVRKSAPTCQTHLEKRKCINSHRRGRLVFLLVALFLLLEWPSVSSYPGAISFHKVDIS